MPSSSVRTVGDVMTGDLMALGPDDSMAHARTVLTESGLHAIPIIQQDEPLGMITLVDCKGRRPDDLLKDLMATPALTIDTEATIGEAAELMRAHYVHHLIVTQGRDGPTVGMVSSYDLLAGLIE